MTALLMLLSVKLAAFCLRLISSNLGCFQVPVSGVCWSGGTVCIDGVVGGAGDTARAIAYLVRMKQEMTETSSKSVKVEQID